MIRPLALASILLLTVSCTTLPEAAALLGTEYYNLGNSYFELKKYDQAARAYQTALGFSPDLRLAAFNLALTRAQLGDYPGALSLLDPLLEKDPTNLLVEQQRAWVLSKSGQTEAAADAWSSLAASLPTDAATQFNAGLALTLAQRPGPAREALRRWNEVDGKSASGLQLLAENVSAQGLVDEAVELYRKALDQGSPTATQRVALARGLAERLEQQGHFGDALEAWKTAKEGPPSPGKEVELGKIWFRMARLELLHIEDYDAGLSSLKEAAKAGYKDPGAWKALKEDPTLKFRTALSADLKSAEVAW